MCHTQELYLNDNQLTDGCLEALQDAGLLTLHTLSLAGNRFSTLESLEPLVRPHLFATSRPLFARARSLRSLPSSANEPPSFCSTLPQAALRGRPQKGRARAAPH